MRSPRPQILPSPVKRKRRERASRELAFRWREVIDRISIGQCEGEVMQTWIVADHQHSDRPLGQGPDVFPELPFRHFVDATFEDHLRRLQSLRNWLERTFGTNRRRT